MPGSSVLVHLVTSFVSKFFLGQWLVKKPDFTSYLLDIRVFNFYCLHFTVDMACYNLNYVCVFSMDSRNLTSVSSVHSVHDILYTVYKSVHFCYIYQLKIL